VVAHTTQRWIIALVLEIGLLAYPAPFKSANVIASDPVSTCLYLWFIASLFWFGARPSLRRYLPLCLIVFLGITPSAGPQSNGLCKAPSPRGYRGDA
jgi:hypothetical protein